MNLLHQAIKKSETGFVIQRGYPRLASIRRWIGFGLLVVLFYLQHSGYSPGPFFLICYTLICLLPLFEFKRWEIDKSSNVVSYTDSSRHESICNHEISEVVSRPGSIWILCKDGHDLTIPVAWLPKSIKTELRQHFGI